MKNKKSTIIIFFLLIVIISLLGMLGYKILKNNNKKEEKEETKISQEENNKEDSIVIVQEEKIDIFNGEDRPIAVMLDNHKGAWPHAGINQAYLVYEIIVEGGETRLMALFKGKDLDVIGPVRSSRHYFLDYALENDAIYVHHGWSPQAQSDISTLGVNNINGIQESSKNFWRINTKSTPHNLVTSTSSILSIAERKGYRTTSTKSSVLNYSADEVNLEDAIEATTVTIPHSSLQTVKYIYDSENKVYTRYARNKLQTDETTGEAVTTKNIIVTFCDNYTLEDSENKGRQGLNNIGTFDGYYITNGKAIEIKCTKNSRTAQTIYKTLDGEEIDVNDGNTFINICPTNADVKIEN